MLEVYALIQDMRGLLSTYVGRGVGEEVLSGKIQRGDGETIFAVILFADVKGFTEMSNTRPAPEVIQVLNQFYDAVEPAVRGGNGEILKFIGDGVLAIFPIKDNLTNQETTATAALNAVAKTQKKLASEAQKTKIEFRAALHVGDIFYGNIGSERRLDFTAIGKSVNLASRMAEEASRRDAQLVCSPEFFDITSGVKGHQVTSQLKGFHETVKIIVLD